MMRRLAVAASGSEATHAANGVAQGQTGSERVAGAERRHVVLAHIPGRCGERRDQSAGKNSAGLECADAENIAGMAGVIAPVIDDVKNLCAYDPAEHNQDAKIPRLLAVDSEALGVADTNPEAQQDAQRNQEAIRWQEESTEMQKLRVHRLF